MKSDDLFKALADANRRKILNLLKRHDSLTAGEIAEHFPISKPAVSEHLKILRNADLIYARKQGQFVYYNINATIIQELFSIMFDLLQTKKEYTDEDAG